MQGFLNLNKSAKLTSHDCVDRVRKALKLRRVGHGGTLDPDATGVLPIALGKATRLLQYLDRDKGYRATIRLGVKTTTDDLAGEVMTSQPAPDLQRHVVEAALPQFQGTIQQIPPIYSAIQVQGKRLHQLARSGQKVEAPMRTVQIYQITVLDWRSGDFPEIDLAIACGTGTYIRSIARDLGDVLGVGGTLAALVRTESSGFTLSDSLTLDQFIEQVNNWTFQPIPVDAGLKHIPPVTLTAKEAQRWCQGQKISLHDGNCLADLKLGRIYNEAGKFLGIGRLVSLGVELILVPELVFSLPE